MKSKRKQEHQAPCCIALVNAKGVACASDTDDTIFKLSATKPVGIAINSLINLAVITRNEGFTWLNRKSWYHHKDIGGRYGSMGV